MKLAEGTKNWIIRPLSLSVIFLGLSLIFNNEKMSIVFLLISVILILLTILFIIFFRDPIRTIGEDIVAVADGKIREIKKTKDKEIGDCFLISTFMNIYNVHVNRMPYDGEILDIKHISGSYIPAFKKESEKNERVVIVIKTDIGKIKIILIAGTLARRIVPYIKKGDKIKKGDRISIIRLGSRVDIFIPSKIIKKIKIGKNDMIKAGEDSIVKIND